jgi:hypothetical protein
MNLSVLDRLVLLKILPKEGDYATLKVLTNLRLSLSFSEDEMKDWGITGDAATNRTSWQVDGKADIPIGEKATDIIVDALKKLNREKKLSFDDMTIYEKFIPTTE